MSEQKERTYCGSGKQTHEAFVNITLCVSDIPKDKIFEYKGKKYLKLTLGKKREPDQYGKTHWLAIDDFKPDNELPASSHTTAPTEKSYAKQAIQEQTSYTLSEESDEFPFLNYENADILY